MPQEDLTEPQKLTLLEALATGCVEKHYNNAPCRRLCDKLLMVDSGGSFSQRKFTLTPAGRQRAEELRRERGGSGS